MTNPRTMMALNAATASLDSAPKAPPGVPIPSGRGMAPKPLNPRRSRTKGTIAGFNGEITSVEKASSQQNHQAQHGSNDSSVITPSKPCYSAWLVLLSTQNSLKLGSRTQLSLCPPGRNRRNLQQALRQKSRTVGHQSNRSLKFDSEMSAYYGLDKLVGDVRSLEKEEEDYLSQTNTFDVGSDEEASSGDEDALLAVEELINPDGATSLDNEQKYAHLREPLFQPVGTDPALQSRKSLPTGTAASGKLPFNRRKLRYFDSITALDLAKTRAYLREEERKCKQRDAALLAKHLRRVQKRERRRLQLERGETPDVESDDEAEDKIEKSYTGVSQIKEPMTSSLSAALVLESLSMNPKESIEGMAKCYDGIVAAGVALLDSQLMSTENDKPRISRSIIMAALEPLLITSLEQPSGEVILQLAKMRRMCGTPRYQRRFVQRVAPCLVRPPYAAIWCLQHQNDMEPILAAVEMIFDSSFQIFKKGWYERGQLLLADSVRKKTLDSAAQQLKNLSSEPEDGHFALNSTGIHGMRHGRTKLLQGTTPSKDKSGGNAPLAEWEVIAVDRQIRISISNIMGNDWSRVAIVSKDVENALRNRRGRPDVERPSLARSRSAEASPKSPKRTTSGNPPLSPPSARSDTHHLEVAATESMESVFGPSFASQPLSETPDPPGSVPPPPMITPVSPPMPRRRNFDDGESTTSSHKGQFPGTTTTAAGPSVPEIARTPPRSPTSPTNEELVSATSAPKPSPQAASPSRPTNAQDDSGAAQNVVGAVSSPSHPSFATLERVERAPLSPSGSVATEAAPYRAVVSSASSVASSTTASSQPAHYRMLTSTAAERKRTVAACRALRAQIYRFEEAFMQLHGRAPKGAAERAPLATTYAQYREWKRAIRADAACRIQALFRGARVRWMLLRSNNPRMARVVMTRAGRASFARQSVATETVSTAADEAVIRQLGIPMEIGANEGARGPGRISSTSAPSQPNFDDPFLTSSPAASAPLAPQWSTPSRRSGASDAFRTTSTPPPPYASPQGTPSPSGAATGYQHMSLPELQAHKKELKQQLKQYDMNFARQHGRMPVKSEKEPIRHLYENYNSLKSQIQIMEQEGQHLPPSMQPQNARTTQRSVSPPLAVVSGPDSSGDDSSPNTSPNVAMARPARRRPTSRQSPPLAESSPSSSTPTGAPSHNLADLKAEKQKLHQMLRSYERDFFREHRRQVSSFVDIKPVASQYRRYKEIKKAIASLQQGGER